MDLSPQRVRQIIEIAYVLEPLLDKDDCTTRFNDLPGKPLTDFIVAGINVGRVFEGYAEKVITKKSRQMFSHYPMAVEVSNEFKRKKFMTVGLLEFMFVFLRTRLLYSEKERFFENITVSLKETDNQDVLDCLGAFRIAVKTSSSEVKKKNVKRNYDYFSKAESVHELYSRCLERFPDEKSTGHQVAYQYLNGFPIAKRYVSEINEEAGLIKSIEGSYNRLHKEFPHHKIGILADLAAVAIFLHLSYKSPDYVIR